MTDTQELDATLAEATQTLHGVLSDLQNPELVMPMVPTVNPMLWELGHTGWFQERFVLRELLGQEPLVDNADELWNSSTVHHDTRWDLALPGRDATVQFVDEVTDRVRAAVAADPENSQLAYGALYTVMHHDAHVEALLYTRQAEGIRPPAALTKPSPDHGPAGSETSGQIQVAGATHLLGGVPEQPFVMDNEKWAHEVEVADYEMDRNLVTQQQFLEFVDDGGYERRELWDDDGWQWRTSVDRQHPIYWRHLDGEWQRRNFDQWVGIEPRKPMVHANWWEARAWCEWSGRRLPTEAEWERAATFDLSGERRLGQPWGDAPAEARRAAIDIDSMGTVSVDQCVDGASELGFLHLAGNVWEWTDTVFQPFPGFVPDSYLDNSAPWFGSRRVLRGGSWATRSRYVRTTFRNYFTPDRSDVYGGFRSCSRDGAVRQSG